MRRLIYFLTVMLVAAGIIHIVIVLLIPSYASKDAWAQLSKEAGKWTFNTVTVPGQQVSPLARHDPALGVAACFFDLGEAPLRVEAGGDLPFWSAAVFDRRGQNIYSFNDRTAIERELLMLVVNPAQRSRLRKNPIEELEQALIVEADITEGFVLLRALQSDDSWSIEVQEFLQDATCEKFVMPDENEARQTSLN